MFSYQRQVRRVNTMHRTTSIRQELERLGDENLPEGWEKGITPEGFLYYIEYNLFFLNFYKFNFF